MCIIRRCFKFSCCCKTIQKTFSNNVDILILALLGTFSVELLVEAFHIAAACHVLSITLLLLVPHMVLIFYVCYVLANKAGITQWLERKK